MKMLRRIYLLAAAAAALINSKERELHHLKRHEMTLLSHCCSVVVVWLGRNEISCCHGVVVVCKQSRSFMMMVLPAFFHTEAVKHTHAIISRRS